MISPTPGTASTTDTTPTDPTAVPPPEAALPPTPWRWRIMILVALVFVGAIAYFGRMAVADHPQVAYRVQAGAGLVFFLGLAALLSKSLQSVNRKTILW